MSSTVPCACPVSADHIGKRGQRNLVASPFGVPAARALEVVCRSVSRYHGWDRALRPHLGLWLSQEPERTATYDAERTKKHQNPRQPQ